jgi:DNA-binding CsgD family transcriptional regulator
MRALSFLGMEAAERPRLSAATIRQLARLGTVVRWPGLLFAAVLSLVVPPRSALGLAALLIWVAVYNAWGMVAISRADDRAILRIGRALTLLDTVSYFIVLFVFGGVGASTSIYAAYMLLIVWLVAFDGAAGAAVGVAIFILGMLGLQAALMAAFHLEFAARDALLWSLIMVVAGGILAAYDRIVVGGVLPASSTGVANGSSPAPVLTAVEPPAGDNAEIRLSRREHEVLRFVAEGYSNSMIANRLHLSENTIKTYVESLLSRLNARNRAEAVAAASRHNLI